MSNEMNRGASIHIDGIVQGVGFRPFVYNLAGRFGLAGVVRNTSAGVEIEVDGAPEVLQAFVQALQDEAPPLSRIDNLSVKRGAANGFSGFKILDSARVPEAFQPISPDVGICEDCRREMLDPQDRRYRYPFINCTNCGPRFTIILDIPYDRPQTTMSRFEMCPDCAREYADPENRRFHAQPVACPVCGPRVWLEVAADGEAASASQGDAAIAQARQLLAQGQIVAIKGLGGFHLACDASNGEAVRELRRRKLRVDKPFALMLPDIAAAEEHCVLTAAERALLESVARPIVILKRRPASSISRDVAPGQDWLGVMLPYAPLHHLLIERFETFPVALVMTSGNLSEEPIATDNDEARHRLAGLADAFLMHDRDIHIRCDDSVIRALADGVIPETSAAQYPGPSIYPLRRSRGYAPFPVRLPWKAAPLLAVGAELKNTFCITNRDYGFLSQHIGDMENLETLQSFETGVTHFERLFRVRPEALAHDLHPDYLTTRYALRRAESEGLTTIGVQHHHAHVAACMAEHRLDGSDMVIGVAFDGTGYGEDGAIWGGEVLLANYAEARRRLHLRYFPLPGGDVAIKQPARVALALLWSLGLGWDDRLAPAREFEPDQRMNLLAQLEKRVNTPLTSSMGRLFDAAAALAGVRQKVNYEAQAAIEFEAMADDAESMGYPFPIRGEVVELAEALRDLVSDVVKGTSPTRISARFHNGLAQMVLSAASQLRSETGCAQVVLTGGVWQNITLLRRTLSLLQNVGFKVYIHREVPPNDGGLSLGQAAVAAYRLRVGYVPGSTGTNSSNPH